MIPSTQEGMDKMKEVAERNIANGDWGEETTIPGVPGGTIPMTPDERVTDQVLAKQGDKKLPKK